MKKCTGVGAISLPRDVIDAWDNVDFVRIEFKDDVMVVRPYEVLR